MEGHKKFFGKGAGVLEYKEYKAKLEFPQGSGEGCKTNTFHGGNMNCTILLKN